MKYRLERCPTCQLRPLEEYDLPPAFPAEERIAVTCWHCGTRLWAILGGKAGEGVLEVVFRPRAEDTSRES